MNYSNPELTNPRIHPTLRLLSACTEHGALPPQHSCPLPWLVLHNSLICQQDLHGLPWKHQASNMHSYHPLILDWHLPVPTPGDLHLLSDLPALYSILLMQTQCLQEPLLHFLTRMDPAFSLGPVYSITSISPSGLVLFLLIQCPK